jgi:hypothetical protein
MSSAVQPQPAVAKQRVARGGSAKAAWEIGHLRRLASSPQNSAKAAMNCRTMRDMQAHSELFAAAYNRCNFLRRLALPKTKMGR